ncbi:class I SAM-dependent methyltransferase [Candidatus Pacearchaeota archaeon]|nr:class I SAM-dependent methyltransferase [Candidatus Pacearchaeota archaeon]
MECRFCKSSLENLFIDLGHAPPSNSFLSEEDLDKPELSFPLKVFLCDKCFLVQIPEYKNHRDIFGQEYAYFSSSSKGWVEHAKNYVEMMLQRFPINERKKVVEIASNDGYLLQHFHARGIPVLGIEPSTNAAEIARTKDINTVNQFFNQTLAETLKTVGTRADLLIGNNVLAHVPDLNNFVCGMKTLLNEDGLITMEFPHVMRMIENCEFDTIYHEHFSYFSFLTINEIFEHHGFSIFDVEELPTHGGSLRIYAKHKNDDTQQISENVNQLLSKEKDGRMDRIEYYQGFKDRVEDTKYKLLEFLVSRKLEGKKTFAYGAAAKLNTLLNFCGIRDDTIQAAVDTTPYKQGKYLPGSHIKVHQESYLASEKPDIILIGPWNYRDEIVLRLSYTREWGARLFTAIPSLQEH